MEGHTNRVWSVGFSPDGKFIVSGSDDKTVRVWDANNGVEVVFFFFFVRALFLPVDVLTINKHAGEEDGGPH